MNIFKNAKFIKSCNSNETLPENRLQEVVFVGKSNVGKSSILNALTNQKQLAFTSSKPGHTRLLNYFLIENRFYFVDCPGYGFSSKKGEDYNFYGNMLENYFNNNEYLSLIIFLLDSRRIPNDDDVTLYKFIKSTKYKFVIVATKCDKLNQSERSKVVNNFKTKFLDINEKSIIFTSIRDERSIGKLKDYIEKNLK